MLLPPCEARRGFFIYSVVTCTPRNHELTSVQLLTEAFVFFNGGKTKVLIQFAELGLSDPLTPY